MEWDLVAGRCSRTGAIRVSVTGPDGAPLATAQVRIDQAQVAAGSASRPLERGNHRVVITAPGMREETRDVEVTPGQTRQVDVTLQQLAGALRLEVRNPLGAPPPGMRVLVDSRPLAAPFTTSLPVGVHRVEVLAENFRPLSREVSILLDQSVELVLLLEPFPGSVRVLTRTGGSQVFLDGARIEGEPALRTNVPAGVHTLRVEARGHRPRVSEVTVLPGREAAVEVPALEEAGPEELECNPGRSRSARTEGHCCWEGQVWAGGRCRGEPRCPRSTVQRGEVCEPVCAEGRVPMTDGFTCCYPGQAVYDGVCRGVPRCPGDRVRRGETCVTDRSPAFFRHSAAGLFGVTWATGSGDNPNLTRVGRVQASFGFQAGPVEMLLGAGYGYGRVTNRELSSVTGGLAVGVQLFSWPRGDHNVFSPINLSAGLLGDFVMVSNRTGGPQRFQGRFGFYLAETAYLLCGLGLRVYYEQTLVTESLPSSLGVTILATSGRPACR